MSEPGLEERLLAKAWTNLLQLVRDVMGELEPGWPGDVADVDFGFSDEQGVVIEVGEFAYTNGREAGQIVESSPTRVRVLSREGVHDAYRLVPARPADRPELN